MPKPQTELNINAELAAMERMTPKQLREKYVEVFGDPTRSGNRRFMIKRIAWRMQANAEGDIEQRMKRIRARAMELARDSDLRTTAPKRPQTPAEPNDTRTVERSARFAAADEQTPGTQLTRHYKGRTVVVTVLVDGFEHHGVKHRSLSAAAKAVAVLISFQSCRSSPVRVPAWPDRCSAKAGIPGSPSATDNPEPTTSTRPSVK